MEQGLFLSESRHALTGEALERSQVCIIEKTALLAMFRVNPEIAIKMIESVSRAMGELEHKLAGLTFKKAEARIAEVLIDLSSAYGKKTSEGLLINVSLRREEIAEMSGTALETVVRFLSRLRERNILAVKGKEIVVRDGDALARISN